VADEKGREEKSIEMRVSELEDKLAQLHITEDELKAYQKVSRLMGTGGAAGAAGAAAGGQVAAGCILDCGVSGCLTECLIRACTIVRACTVVRQCTIVRQCTWECFECGGGCAPGGGTIGGGGFGGLGG
jgi:hypothetical protein